MCEFPLTRRVLVLGAHPDDGELGCGATMARLAQAGATVHYAMFSPCEESLPADAPKDILRREATEAAKALGILPDNLLFFGYKVRKFPYVRQEILEDLVLLRQRLRPDLVFVPSNNDLHQDHAVIAAEGWRAFKATSILGYEITWNNLSFPTQFFSKVTTEQLECKIRALRSYRSQRFRSYAKDSFIRSLAEVRGTQIGNGLAEAFEVIRWIA